MKTYEEYWWKCSACKDFFVDKEALLDHLHDGCENSKQTKTAKDKTTENYIFIANLEKDMQILSTMKRGSQQRFVFSDYIVTGYFRRLIEISMIFSNQKEGR